MNIDNDCKKLLKVKRRKSRAERNKIKEKQLHSISTQKQKSRGKKKGKNEQINEKGNFANACIPKVVFGGQRLTRRLGLFNQMKTSETVVKDNTAQDSEDLVEKELQKILHTSPYESRKSVASISIDRRQKLRTVGKKYIDSPRPSSSSLSESDASNSSLDTHTVDRELKTIEQKKSKEKKLLKKKHAANLKMESRDQTKDDFPLTPDFDEIAKMLSSTLTSEKLFPGKNLFQNTQNELRRLLQRNNSPALDQAKHGVSSASKSRLFTPWSGDKARTPLSKSKRIPLSSIDSCKITDLCPGSLSSETVTRCDDVISTRNRSLLEKHDTATPRHTTAIPLQQVQTEYPKPKDKQYKKANDFFKEDYYCKLVQDTRATYKHCQPVSAKETFIPEVALTDGKALLDCNERVSERSRSAQEAMYHRDFVTECAQVRRKSDTSLVIGKHHEPMDYLPSHVTYLKPSTSQKYNMHRKSRYVDNTRRKDMSRDVYEIEPARLTIHNYPPMEGEYNVYAPRFHQKHEATNVCHETNAAFSDNLYSRKHSNHKYVYDAEKIDHDNFDFLKGRKYSSPKIMRDDKISNYNMDYYPFENTVLKHNSTNDEREEERQEYKTNEFLANLFKDNSFVKENSDHKNDFLFQDQIKPNDDFFFLSAPDEVRKVSYVDQDILDYIDHEHYANSDIYAHLPKKSTKDNFRYSSIDFN